MTKALFEAISRYFDKDRKAEVYKILDVYYVGMFVGDQLVEFRSCRGKAEIFAENTAENFVFGIGEFNKQYDMDGVFN